MYNVRKRMSRAGVFLFFYAILWYDVSFGLVYVRVDDARAISI